MTKDYLKRQFSNFYNDVIKGSFAKKYNLKTLEDLRTDRRLIWNDEFESLDTTKWSPKDEPLPDYDTADAPAYMTSELYTVKDSILTLSGKLRHSDKSKTTIEDKCNTKDRTRARIISKVSFRNCLIEFKSKGLGGVWFRTLNIPSNSFSNKIADNNNHAVEIDVAEYYGDSDKKFHFNLHCDNSDGHKTHCTAPLEADTEWHIWGIDMCDSRTIKYYKDRKLIGTLTLKDSDFDSMGNPLLSYGLSAIIDTPTNVPTVEDSEISIDWIRVYSNEQDELYQDMATVVNFMNRNGKVFDNSFDYYAQLDNIYTADGSKLETYLKYSPTNTYMCPTIDEIKIGIMTDPAAFSNTSLDNIEKFPCGTSGNPVIIVKTGGNLIRGIVVDKGEPTNLITTLSSEVAVPTNVSLFKQAVQQCGDGGYLLPLKDIATNEKHYLCILQGAFYDLKGDIPAIIAQLENK